MLNEQQLAQFRTFGFVPLRALLSPVEMATLSAEFERGLDAEFGAANSDLRARQWALMTRPELPAFTALLEDPRFSGIAEQVMPKASIGIAADASRFTDDTTWHADTFGFDHFGVKFLFYFEPLRAQNGALRAIPASHRQPLHDELATYVRRYGDDIAPVPAFVFESEPGDVFVYDVRVYHASCGGRRGRRGASLVYYHDPQTPEQQAAIRQQDRLSRGHIRDFRRSAGLPALVDHQSPNPLFHPGWLDDPAMSPQRRHWIERLRALGFLSPLTEPLDERNRLPHR